MNTLNYIKSAVLLIAISLFSSCVKDIDLDYLRPTPKLVLNCLASVGDTVKATVSRTWFYTDEKPNIGIKEADVKLYVNDVFREQMEWREGIENYRYLGYFISSYIPAPGDQIRIDVSAPEMGAVSANAVVPTAPSLIDLKYEVKADTTGNMIIRTTNYSITLRDDASKSNYYLMRLDRGDPYKSGDDVYYEWQSASIDYSGDPLFGGDISVLDKVFGNDWLSGYRGRVFTDESINGTEYTIRLTSGTSYSSYYPGSDYPGYDYPGYVDPDEDEKQDYPTYLRASLYTISSSYYFYLRALEMRADDSFSNALIDAGLAEPIRVFSNVEGGVGVLGTCCGDTVSVVTGYYRY